MQESIIGEDIYDQNELSNDLSSIYDPSYLTISDMIVLSRPRKLSRKKLSHFNNFYF